LLGPEPYERFTANTPTTWQAFNANVGLARTRGYGVDNEAMALGVVCIGAPVLDGGRVVGAISVSAPRTRLPDDRIDGVGGRVVAAAAEVSARLGPHQP
jgi:IclR family acetate operon transcriptional repressor